MKTLLLALCLHLAPGSAHASALSPDFFSGPGWSAAEGRAGKALSREAFRAALAKSDVIYAGETHDQKYAHLAQLEALRILADAKKDRVAVGFEMLNQTLQPVLDDYASGKISEEEFLAKADWKKEWGFDFALYRPIFDFIRERKLKALALNVPKRIVSKIARGGMESLTPEEKVFLPKKVRINADKVYLEYLKETFGSHGSSPMSRMFKFENYLASMAAWNEGMGAKAAEFLNANKGWGLLVAAGNGHVLYNAGIPYSVKARTRGLVHASVYTEDAAGAEDFLRSPKPLADYVWFVPYEKKETPAPAVSTAAPAGN